MLCLLTTQDWALRLEWRGNELWLPGSLIDMDGDRCFGMDDGKVEDEGGVVRDVIEWKFSE